MNKLVSLLVVCGAMVAQSATAAPFEVGEVVDVVDVQSGSRVTILLAGKERQVRVYGVESPAGDQLFAKEAAAAARKLLRIKPLLLQIVTRAASAKAETVARLCVPRDPKKIPRPPKWSSVKKKCLGEALLDQGLAWRHAQDAPPKEYAGWQASAKESAYGLWNRPHPIPPWSWRKMGKAARRKHIHQTKRAVARLKKAVEGVGAALKRGGVPKSRVPKRGVVVTYSGSDRDDGSSSGKTTLSFAQLKKPFKMTVDSDGKGWNTPKKQQVPTMTVKTFTFKTLYKEADFSWDYNHHELKAEAQLDASESVELRFKIAGKRLELVRLQMSSEDPG